jgi:acyl-CoA thioesterase-2
LSADPYHDAFSGRGYIVEQALERLLRVLDPQAGEPLVFSGENMHPQAMRIYGGQVLGQCVAAAMATVDPERRLHSQHAYFLRPGNPREPVLLEVEKARDGWSFSSRRVVALQAGRPILVSSLSFQVDAEGESFQPEMPAAPPPGSLRSERERALAAGSLDDAFMVTTGSELDVRMVEPIDWNQPGEREPQLQIWMKASAPVGDRRGVHEALLAYMSDAFLIDVCLVTRGLHYGAKDLQVASLDHALWFHDQFRADEWLLHVVETLRMSAGRGLAHGSFYTTDGRLVATSMQQGLMRRRSDD